MIMVKTLTGVRDEITELRVGKLDIDVTFKSAGYFKVNKIMNLGAYMDLERLEVGQKVLLATDEGSVAGVRPI